MIIDCILSRYEESRENGSYYSESFRNRIADYIYEDISDADEIVDAMDNGNEQEVKASLITYLIDKGYNPRIIDYVLSVDWLKDIPNEQPSVINLDAKPANEQEYQKQIEYYKQIANELTGENTYDINNELQNTEINAIYNFLNACKIYDIAVMFDNNIIIAKDDYGNRWEGEDFYRFLLEEVITLGADGKPVDGFYIDDKVVSSVLEFAKKYGYKTSEYNIDKTADEPDICEMGN